MDGSETHLLLTSHALDLWEELLERKLHREEEGAGERARERGFNKALRE